MSTSIEPRSTGLGDTAKNLLILQSSKMSCRVQDLKVLVLSCANHALANAFVLCICDGREELNRWVASSEDRVKRDLGNETP